MNRNVKDYLILKADFDFAIPRITLSKGRLVNMISFCTECPLPTLSVYTATKAALFSLSNGMRMELAK